MKRTRIRSRSPERERERSERDAVRAAVTARAGGVCELHGYGRCWHPRGEPLDVHESPRRSQLKGAHLVEPICVLLCRGHHDIEDADPALAQLIGIRIPLEVYLAYPRKALLQSRALRVVTSSIGAPPPEPPYWLADDWGGVDLDHLECDLRGDSTDPRDPLGSR